MQNPLFTLFVKIFVFDAFRPKSRSFQKKRKNSSFKKKSDNFAEK